MNNKVKKGETMTTTTTITNKSSSLWNVEETDAARHALLALQGVHASLHYLRGVLAADTALYRPSVAGILRRIEISASCRERLESCIEHTLGTRGGQENRRSGGNAVAVSMAVALHDVLRSIDQRLSSIESKHGVDWVFESVSMHGEGKTCGVAVEGRVAHQRGLSVLTVAVLTSTIQKSLRILSNAFVPLLSLSLSAVDDEKWDGDGDGGRDGDGDKEGGDDHPMTTREWLSTLHRIVRREYAEDAWTRDMIEYVYGRVVAPYLAFLCQWAFSINALPIPATANGQYDTVVAPFLTTLHCFEKNEWQQDGLHIPAPLPDCLEDETGMSSPLLLWTRLVNTGLQLRLLHSVGDAYGCIDVVGALCEGWVTVDDCADGDDGGSGFFLRMTHQSCGWLHDINDDDGTSSIKIQTLGEEEETRMMDAILNDSEAARKKKVAVERWLRVLQQQRNREIDEARAIATGVVRQKSLAM